MSKRRVIVKDLGNISAFHNAGSRESERVQYALKDSVTHSMRQAVPDGAVIHPGKPLNRAWEIDVSFTGGGTTDTDAYRNTVKREFPGASVKNSPSGDTWTVPYSSGIASGKSPCLTLFIAAFCLLVSGALAWAAFGSPL